MFITQISVYLENNKGTLRSLTKTLAEHNIDMIALSIADTTSFGIVRIVVRSADVKPAIAALHDNGFIAKVSQVLCVAVPNQPAGLDRVLAIIEEKNISIEYMYSLYYNIENKALMVLRLATQDVEKEDLAKLFETNNVMMITQDIIDNM